MNHVNEEIASSPAKPSVPANGQENLAEWETRCEELLAEREMMRRELEEVKKERELYRRALQATLPVEEVPFTKEDILAQRGTKPPLSELITDLENKLSA